MSPRDLRQQVIEELAALPDARVGEVLDYVRFLRFQSMSRAESDQAFKVALATARHIAKQEGITEEDIQTEIAKVRSKP
jgi:hypothetical protein